MVGHTVAKTIGNEVSVLMVWRVEWCSLVLSSKVRPILNEGWLEETIWDTLVLTLETSVHKQFDSIILLILKWIYKGETTLFVVQGLTNFGDENLKNSNLASLETKTKVISNKRRKCGH